MDTLCKSPTRIAGLDSILHGGLPTGHTTLIIGGPGSGKTVFGLEFLYRGALAGQPGIFVTFEERTDALRANAETLGWQFAPLEAEGKFFFLDGRVDPRAVITGEFGIQPFLAILDHKIRAMGAKHIVIDALDVLMRLIDDDKRKQNELTALHQWLSERDITAVLSAKAPRDGDQARHYEFLDYLADCVIHLDNRVVGQLSTRRLRVVKFRGSGFGSNEYPFVIAVPGITLLPISEVGLSHRDLGERVSTGLPELDALVSGGFRRSSSVLLTGSTGTGKTTLCSVFTQAACARGETVLYLSFEESESALLSAMRSPGIDLRAAIDSGRLRVMTAMPEAMGAEQHLVRIFTAIREIRPVFVVVESASACKRMGTEQAAFEFLMRLINSCKETGITTIVTNQTAGFQNVDEVSGIGISSLIDTVIVLRLVERGDVLRRRLLVMKARGSQHSHRFHDFRITDDGVVIGGSDAG